LFLFILKIVDDLVYSPYGLNNRFLLRPITDLLVRYFWWEVVFHFLLLQKKKPSPGERRARQERMRQNSWRTVVFPMTASGCHLLFAITTSALTKSVAKRLQLVKH
jgi:hypothetical protein